MSFPASRNLLVIVAALAIIALILSSAALSIQFTRPAPQTGVRSIYMVGGEWKTTLDNGTVVERYRFDPATIVVFKGDTVQITLQIVNGRDHTFILEEFGVNRVDLDKPVKITISFGADKVGIFSFDCTAHEGMHGTLVVIG